MERITLIVVLALCLTVAAQVMAQEPSWRALNQEAMKLYREGKYAEASKIAERALGVAEKTFGPDHPSVALALNNLALLYRDRGMSADAESHFKRSLATFERALGKDHPHVAVPLGNLGHVYRDRGDHSEALRMFQRSLQIFKSKGIPHGWPQNLIADLYLDRGDIAAAESSISGAGTDWLRGRLCLLKKDYKGARDYYEFIRIFAEENRVIDRLFIAYTGLGMAFEGLGEYEHAATYYWKAVECTEELRSSLKLADRKNFFDVRIYGFYRTAPYEGYVRVMLRMKKPLEALKGSEYCKARMYAERISVQFHAVPLGVRPDVLQRDKGIQHQLAAFKQLREEAYKQKNQARIKALEPHVRQLEEQFTDHVQMLREKYPRFAATKYPQPRDVKENAVKAEEWTLSYQITDTGIGIWLLKGRSLVDYRFRPIARDDLDHLVRSFRKPLELKAITKENLLAFKDALGKGKELFDILVGDLLKSIRDGQPLVVVPDGILGILPFEMLVIKEGHGWNTSTDYPYPEGVVYFGDRNPLSYYQSLTALTLARTLGPEKQAGARTLVLADPVFECNDPRLDKTAPKKFADAVAHILKAIRDETGLVFRRISLTGTLGTTLAGLYRDLTDLHSGVAASKQQLFKKRLDPYRYVVFATHGYGGRLPGLGEPVLVLTLPDQPENQDGFLRMSEVMSLDLCADVVALTACQTGLGQEIKGEGTMGMGRAFQDAGAKSVLVSLWSVSAGSTTDLAEKFFKYLKQGKNRLEALQHARKEIRSEGYEHPFYWAPFVLVGEIE